ncbi:Endonuclease/exonuclease/phosphatase, partial [Pisolithus albus]
MTETPSTVLSHLRIWQQNLNHSGIAQHSLLHGPHSANWDIYALQEPHVHPNGNTISSPKFYMVYPSTHLTNPNLTPRAALLVSTSLSTNAWHQIPFPSPDMVVIQLITARGKATLINMYNDSDKHD